MNTSTENNKDTLRWNRTSWLWVFLCTAAIFSTVPMARRVQRYVNNTIGRDFFTYIVLVIVISLFISLLYSFVFRLRVKSKSQYAWLIISSGAYIYTTLQLRKYPEEAIHLLEFGLLSYFLFSALSHRIRDWTVYITTSLCVLFIGTLDEFIQWLTPGRFWDYRDVGLNALAGIFFVLGLSKGIKPEIIRGPVKKISVNMLTGIMIINLLFLGLCLSNTPDAVKHYTSVFPDLSWLRQEETMSQYGHEQRAFLRRADYSGTAWKLISLFNVRSAWSLIIALIVSVWVYATFWKKRLDDN